MGDDGEGKVERKSGRQVPRLSAATHSQYLVGGVFFPPTCRSSDLLTGRTALPRPRRGRTNSQVLHIAELCRSCQCGQLSADVVIVNRMRSSHLFNCVFFLCGSCFNLLRFTARRLIDRSNRAACSLTSINGEIQSLIIMI